MKTETEQKEIKRFEVKAEVKLLKALGNILGSPINEITEEEALKIEGEFMVLDPANVCGIIPLSQEAIRLISRFVPKENRSKTPTLEYKTLGKVKISGDYIKSAINLLITSGETITFTTAKDYPITLENSHFKVIIAPRVEQD